MGVIDGATHMDFGTGGLGAEQVTPLVISTIASFLKGVHEGVCPLPAAVARMSLSAK